MTPEARFFWWIEERHRIFEKRKRGLSRDWWTEDEILRTYRFTNPYREIDRTTVWFREYIRDPLKDDNKVLILDIDVKGGQSIYEEYEDDCITFFVEPPGDNLAENLEILEERLNNRGNENSTLIKRRLQRVSKELEQKAKDAQAKADQIKDKTSKAS